MEKIFAIAQFALAVVLLFCSVFTMLSNLFFQFSALAIVIGCIFVSLSLIIVRLAAKELIEARKED